MLKVFKNLSIPSASSQRQSQNERISQNMNLNGSSGASWNPPASSSCGVGPIGQGNLRDGCAGLGATDGTSTFYAATGYGSQQGSFGVGFNYGI